MAAGGGRAGRGAVLARETWQVGPYAVDVTRKRIKNAWLRVTTPEGPLQLSLPARMSRAQAEAFVLSRAAWVDGRRAELAGRVVQAGARSGHVGADGRVTLWGEVYPLADVLAEAARVRAEAAGRAPRACRYDLTDAEARERAAARALSTLLLARAAPLVRTWEARMGVSCAGLRTRDARSRWGSCNVRTHVIMLSVSLAHYPPACLELICVHELAHLVVRGHGPDFRAVMTRYLPDWPEREALLRI